MMNPLLGRRPRNAPETAEPFDHFFLSMGSLMRIKSMTEMVLPPFLQACSVRFSARSGACAMQKVVQGSAAL
ncbi:hypothetical protein BTR14_19865 [Rhizobium rhizosphaerae]|uniref:Uncharacterized protein n=1 Tax=Xaviernesmea rhizosphaerae TaxID=1672749 RepID=A0ABX3P885_9HYPH|nr:hypothetical protein BTR14_19865 [Xaviernesmea rhizosphaerae]